MTYLTIAIILIVALIVVAFMKRWRRPRLYEILPASEMQKKYGLYAENQPDIRIDPEKVPEHLRDLIPMAEKWGIGDDIIRSDLEEKATETEKKEFQEALRGRTAQVTTWLDSFDDDSDTNSMTEEAGYFMYMLEGLDESGLWPD